MFSRISSLAIALAVSAAAFAHQRYSSSQAVSIVLGEYQGRTYGQLSIKEYNGDRFWVVHVKRDDGYHEALVNAFNGHIERYRPWHVPQGHAYGYWEHHKQGQIRHGNGHGHEGHHAHGGHGDHDDNGHRDD